MSADYDICCGQHHVAAAACRPLGRHAGFPPPRQSLLAPSSFLPSSFLSYHLHSLCIYEECYKKSLRDSPLSLCREHSSRLLPFRLTGPSRASWPRPSKSPRRSRTLHSVPEIPRPVRNELLVLPPQVDDVPLLGLLLNPPILAQVQLKQHCSLSQSCSIPAR